MPYIAEADPKAKLQQEAKFLDSFISSRVDIFHTHYDELTSVEGYYSHASRRLQEELNKIDMGDSGNPERKEIRENIKLAFDFFMDNAKSERNFDKRSGVLSVYER